MITPLYLVRVKNTHQQLVMAHNSLSPVPVYLNSQRKRTINAGNKTKHGIHLNCFSVILDIDSFKLRVFNLQFKVFSMRFVTLSNVDNKSTRNSQGLQQTHTLTLTHIKKQKEKQTEEGLLANNWSYQKRTMKDDTDRLITKHHMNDE